MSEVKLVLAAIVYAFFQTIVLLLKPVVIVSQKLCLASEKLAAKKLAKITQKPEGAVDVA